ncbi:MAG: YihY/virulence factor BrkB family protein [Rickettsiales bacterium]
MFTFVKKIALCLYNAGDSAIYDHDGIEHAGYLAFLNMLALFPFLVLIVAIAGVLGQGEAGAHFLELLVENLPPKAVAAIRPRIEEIVSGPPQGLLTISILGAIWTASSAVEGIRTTLNRAYRVRTPPNYWFRRSLSILQLLLFTLIIIVAMLLLVFLPIVFKSIEEHFGLQFTIEGNASLGNIILYISIGAMFVVVSALYYLLPNIKQTLMNVIPGAVVTVLLWVLAAGLFSLYLSKVDQVNLIYGSLGGVIATLIFFYLINFIFIYGAELNYQLAVTFERRPEEKEAVSGEPIEPTSGHS